MINKSIALTIAILFNSFIYGQRIGFDIIDDSKVSLWMPTTETEYQHAYSFGASEMESTLIILFSEGRYYAQIRKYKMDKSTNWEWAPYFVNLKNVSIQGNRFYSDKTNGEFVIYQPKKQEVKGLKVFKSWSGWEEGIYEIGVVNDSPVSAYFDGKFTQASLRKLQPEELKGMSKFDLKVMRNEIFARYSYKFKPGGKMDSYFKEYNWYSGWYNNVDEFLTSLEIENIKLIKQFEKK